MQRKSIKILGTAFVFTMLFNVFTISALAALQSQGLEESNAIAEAHIQDIKIKYLQNGIKPNGEAIKGIGLDNAGELGGNDAQKSVVQLKENIIGVAALYKDFEARSDESSENWGRSDMYLKIRDLRSTSGTKGFSANGKILTEMLNRKFAIDQFMFLEFASEAWEISDDSNQFSDVQNNFRDGQVFKAEKNASLYNAASFGAYWTLIDSNIKFPQPTTEVDNIYTIYNPFPADNLYPLTNVSLWAAAGNAHFARSQQLREDPQEYFEEARTDAELALAYADTYVWDTFFGLYHEDQDRARPFRVNTQAVALLACARLYQLFQEEAYLIKADKILDSIMNYFWVPALGGVVESYNVIEDDLAGKLMTGYDNALLAYALMQLGIATGAENKDFSEFMKFQRFDNKYTRIAMTVMKFMNNYLWLENSAKTVAGYAEFVFSNGTLTEQYPFANHSRYALTNMLALYNLAAIFQAEKSWWSWNVEFLTYTGAVLGVLILIAIIVIKKRRSGSKLPKVVKGLLGDED